MSDINQDKQLEEYIRETFADYQVHCSNEQKEKLIHEFHHLKIHHKKINISVGEILQNKTFIFITGAIVLVFGLIYMVINLSPAEKNAQNDDNTKFQPIIDSLNVNKKDSISNDKTSIKTQDSLLPTNLNSLPDTRSTNTTKSTANQLNSDTLSSKTDTSYTQIKKKKKRRKKTNDNNNIENNDLPPLEPKTPDLNTKEEE